MNGPELLRAWRESKGWRLGTAARALGVDWGSLRKWEAGAGRPGVTACLKIERATGIAVSAWDKPDAHAGTDGR